MEEKQHGVERTPWIIYASYYLSEFDSRLEKVFIYARDAADAEEIIHRWSELHPEYVIQKYGPSPGAAIE